MIFYFSETETYVSSSDGEPELKRQRLEFATTDNGHTYSMVMSSDDTSAVAAMQAINHTLGDISHQISDVTTGHITIPVTITTDSQIQVWKTVPSVRPTYLNRASCYNLQTKHYQILHRKIAMSLSVRCMLS